MKRTEEPTHRITRDPPMVQRSRSGTQRTEAERRAAGELTFKVRLTGDYPMKIEAIGSPGEIPQQTVRRLIDEKFAEKMATTKKSTARRK